jgi:hypothetical protein
MQEPGQRPRIFFGYPSTPADQRVAMVRAAERLNSIGEVSVKTWQELNTGGRVIITRITEAIDESKVSVFDATGLNENVLFELGYAIGSGRIVWPVRDPTDGDAQRKWEQLGLLKSVGYKPFTSSEDIVAAFQRERPHDDSDSIFDRDIAPHLVAGERPSIFYMPSVHQTDVGIALTDLLATKTKSWSIYLDENDPTETGYRTLVAYCQSLYNSVAAVVHFVAPRRIGAEIHNARCALVAGLARGMKRPLLMLADQDYLTPIDYTDVLHVYRSVRDCVSATELWLDNRVAPIARDSRPPARVLRLETELSSLRLGDYVAEQEEEDLQRYFVETAAFNDVMAGRTTMFVGRKGAGKTANVLEAARRLNLEAGNLVCIIKPVGYEWGAVLRLASQFGRQDAKGYVFESLWKLLLYSEIARAAYFDLKGRPSGIVAGTPEWDFSEFIESRGNLVLDDFAPRLETAVGRLTSIAQSKTLEGERASISEALHEGIIRELRQHLTKVLQGRHRVAVLIDNLDKPWTQDSDVNELSYFLLALLGAVNRINEDLGKRDYRRDSIPISLAVFLRIDIYGQVLKVAREPDKLPATQLEWSNPDVLLRVIEERYAASRSKGFAPDLWKTFFCDTVRGLSPDQYLVRRVLPRPRDLVYICNEAIRSAVNRQRRVVEEQDVLDAEKVYSQFAFEAIQVESEQGTSSFDAVLYEFLGAPPVIKRGEVLAALGRGGIPDERRESMLKQLVAMTFIGPEIGDNRFDFTDQPRIRERNGMLAQQFADRTGSEMRFLVHPAFRGFLEIPEPPELVTWQA